MKKKQFNLVYIIVIGGIISFRNEEKINMVHRCTEYIFLLQSMEEGTSYKK